MTPRVKPQLGPDGIARSAEAEDELDALAASVLARPAGQKLLAYLRSITVHNIQGPRASDAELRHLEGQRFVVALLDMRCERGKRKRGGRAGLRVAADELAAGGTGADAGSA